MSDGSQPISVDIETGKIPSGSHQEWLKEELKVDDNLFAKGLDSLYKIYGTADSHTIFKCKRRAAGRQGPPEPKVVAIGPYHRNRENQLKFDDDYKLKITRFMVRNCRLDAEMYLKEMEDKEEAVRSCYDGGLSQWSSEELPRMLLLDSSFVQFVIDAFHNRKLQPNDVRYIEYMALHLDIREHAEQIKLDLLTVDNQIPFFTIEKLYHCLHGGRSNLTEPIEELALSCFDDLRPMRNEEQQLGKKRKEERVIASVVARFDHLLPVSDLGPRRSELQEAGRGEPDQFHHLLHLFYWSRIPKEGYEIGVETKSLGARHNENALNKYIPSATELKKSATKFKKKDSGSRLDVTFNRGLTFVHGVINIPVLQLYNYSKPIFRNLIAFEATPTNNVSCFTAYAACMSCLLQREDDAKLLRKRGIVASTNYKDGEVVEFFKDLNREIEDTEMPETLRTLYTREQPSQPSNQQMVGVLPVAVLPQLLCRSFARRRHPDLHSLISSGFLRHDLLL